MSDPWAKFPTAPSAAPQPDTTDPWAGYSNQTPQAPTTASPLDNALQQLMPQPAQPGADTGQDVLDQALQQEGLNQPFQAVNPGADAAMATGDFPPGAYPPGDSYLASYLGTDKLGPAGLPDWGLRADLSLSNNDFPSMYAKFKSAYPQGDMTQVAVPNDAKNSDAGQTVTLYRTTPDAPWSRLYETGLSVNQIPDLAGAAPELAGQAAATYLTGGSNLLWRGVAGGVGGALGEALRTGSEYLRGYTPPNVMNDIGSAFVRNTLGTIVGDVIGGGMQMAGGVVSRNARGLTQASPEALAANRFAVQNGLPELMAGQISEQPILNLMHQQLLNKGAAVEKLVKAQAQGAAGLAEARVAKADLADVTKNLKAYNAQAEADVIRTINAPSTTLVGGANKLGAALDQWGQVNKAVVDQMYDTARQLGQPTFDGAQLRGIAQNQLQLEQLGALRMSGDMRNILNDMATLPDSIGQLSVPSAADPTANIVVPAEAFLNKYKGELYQIAHPKPGDPLRTNEEMATARGLLKAIDDTMQNPTNMDQLGPDFQLAWRQANDAARERFNKIEQFEALLPARSRTFKPQELVQSLWNASNDDTIRAVYQNLRDSGLSNRWDDVAGMLKTKLLDTAMNPNAGPQQAMAYLGRFNKQTLDLLLSGSDQAAVKDALRGADLLRQLDVPGILAKSQSSTEAVLRLVKEGGNDALAQLDASLPANAPLRQSIRAGLIDHLASLRKTLPGPGALKGVQVLDGPAIEREIARLQQSGASRFLEPGDTDLMNHIVQYLRFTVGRGDVGTSMAAGQTAGEFLRAMSPGHVLEQGAEAVGGELASHILNIVGAGRLFTSKWGRAMLVDMGNTSGVASPQTQFRKLFRLAGATMFDVAQKMQQEQ